MLTITLTRSLLLHAAHCAVYKAKVTWTLIITVMSSTLYQLSYNLNSIIIYNCNYVIVARCAYAVPKNYINI